MNSDLLDDIEPFYVMEILEEAQKYEKKGIDISHLENGVYFMNVKVGELTYIRKVIKQ